MAEKIIQIGAAEYRTAYVTDANTVHAFYWNTSVNGLTKHTFLAGKAKSADGGQYHVALTDTDGNAYNLNQDAAQQPTLTKLNVSNVEKAYGFYTSTVILYKNGTIGIVGDWMGVTTFGQPSGKIFKELVVSGTSSRGLSAIYALTTDGGLYKYSSGSSTPVSVLTGVTKITAVGVFAIVAQTATDLFFVSGYDSRYVGLPAGVTTRTSIKNLFTTKGAIFPFKEIKGNYNTLHVIDAKDEMYGVGSNAMGEVGNGVGTPYTTNQWDWSNGQLLTPVTQIPGKWKNIQAGNNIAFYLYAQDLSDNWYSWGRNKTFALGNGITLPPWGEGYDKYPNYLDVWKPTHVRPLEAQWKIVNFTATGPKPTAPVVPLPTTPPVDPPTGPTQDQIIAELRAKVTQLEGQVATLTASNAAKDTQINELNVKNTQLTQDLAKAKSDLTAESAKLSRLKADLTAIINNA